MGPLEEDENPSPFRTDLLISKLSQLTGPQGIRGGFGVSHVGSASRLVESEPWGESALL